MAKFEELSSYFYVRTQESTKNLSKVNRHVD
jgi:hypothetical protein